MGQNSKIGWTTDTENDMVGCERATIDVDGREPVPSPACGNCYAEDLMARKLTASHLRVIDERGVWNGTINKVPYVLSRIPSRPRDGSIKRTFAPSLSDPFLQSFIENPDGLLWCIARLARMICIPWVDWQVLTKRPKGMLLVLKQIKERGPKGMMQAVDTLMRTYTTRTNGKGETVPIDWGRLEKLAAEHIPSTPFPYPNICFGTTVENELAARDRLQYLIAARLGGLISTSFVSYEPALGPVDWDTYLAVGGIDWLIIGGESGPYARPMHPEWVREAISAATRYGVPVFFKQHGAWSTTKIEGKQTREARYLDYDKTDGIDEPFAERAPVTMYRVGKAAAGMKCPPQARGPRRLSSPYVFEWPVLRHEQRHAWAHTSDVAAGDTVYLTDELARAAGIDPVRIDLPDIYRRCVAARSIRADYGDEHHFLLR